MEKPIVNIQKYKVPLIWMDTSIFINLGKISAGKKIENHVLERLKTLQRIISEKVKELKLICVEADQEEEIELWRGELEPIRTILSQLSQGVMMRHRNEVESFQIYRLMEVYIQQNYEITLSTSEIFNHDPINEIQSHYNFPYIVRSVTTPPKHIIDEAVLSKKNKQVGLEKLRLRNRKNKIDFGNQLLNEEQGHILSYLDPFQKFIKNPDLLFEDNNFHMNPFFLHSLYWNRLVQKDGDYEGFFQFVKSEFFKAVPVIELECTIYADLLTGSKVIDEGDSIDVQQLSAVVPYCDYVVTDASKHHLLKSRKIESKWNSKTYSFDEHEKLMEDLDSL